MAGRVGSKSLVGGNPEKLGTTELTLRKPGTQRNVAEPGGAPEPKPSGTRRNLAEEPGGTRKRNPAEPGGNLAEPGGKKVS